MSFESVVTIVLTPVFVGVIRLLFASEVQYFLALVYTYFWRPFDIDRDGKTHDWCLLHSAASGTWSYVSLLYRFNPFDGTSGVHVHRYDEVWECVSVERIRFADWMNMRKAAIVTPPPGLEHKIKYKQRERHVEFSV